ncbi:MAG: hypothetical protein RIQ56_124 [Candidatus Parcubacteria bacterium]|jgi:ComF family protein
MEPMFSKLLSAFISFSNTLFDVVLPPTVRAQKTKTLTLSDFSVAPEVHSLHGIDITTLLSYSDTAVQNLIRSLKYDNSHHAVHLCALLLADFLQEEVANLKLLSPRPIWIVPVPLHPSRERERGYNQIARILEALPKEFHDGTHASIRPDTLQRVQDTLTQTRLSKYERWENVRNAFEVKHVVPNVHIIIVDDVATTGATLAACIQTFKKADVSVQALALARA